MKRVMLVVVVLSLAACRNWEEAYDNSIDGGATGGGTGGSTGDGGVDAGICGGQWCLFGSGSAGAFPATQGVWASGPNDAWVTAWGAQVLHWNGVIWSKASTSAANPETNAVWGTSSTRVFVGGANGTAYLGPPFTPTKELVVPGFASLIGIHGLADGGSIYATGRDRELFRYDGTQWAQLDAGLPLVAKQGWRALAVVSETDIWVGGALGVVMHSGDGVSWTRVDTGITEDLHRAFANGPQDVWFVGTGGLILRWNGATFDKPTCSACGNLWGVWGRGSNDMWLLDSDNTLVHWDGQTFTPVPGIEPSADPSFGAGLWGFGDNDLFLATHFADGGSGALHYRR